MVALFSQVIRNEKGDAIVEATILFPIMIMIFAALVLLAIYLPTRGALQRATQYAATAIATTSSDTWLIFDDSSMSYDWADRRAELKNVYTALFSGMGDVQAQSEKIVAYVESRCLSSKAGELHVNGYAVNYLIYKEVVVNAEREFTIPVDLKFLAFIKFPQSIKVSVTSTAVVQNPDEFIRNMDIVVDFVEYIFEKFELTGIKDAINSFGRQVKTVLGW